MKSHRDIYAVAVAIALILASAMLVTFYVLDRPPANPYMTIYLLDTNHKAENYPEFAVAGVNSTFSVYVDVENHMSKAVDGVQVQIKVTNGTNLTFPLNVTATQTFTGNLADGQTWENVATIALDQPGNYLIDFEVWTPNQSMSALEFSGVYTVLNVQVAAPTASP